MAADESALSHHHRRVLPSSVCVQRNNAAVVPDVCVIAAVTRFKFSVTISPFPVWKEVNEPSGAQRLTRKVTSMNLKTCFASTGSALVGMALAGAQPLATRPAGASVDSGLATNVFERTASDKGVTVKVARQAVLWSTTDGSNWVQRTSGTKCLLYDVAYGNGVFVAVGNEGTLLTSPDGITWTARNSQTDQRLRGIAFGNGTFVAVGYEGAVITSKDGVRWKIRNSGTQERLQMVVFDRGTFVAVGWKGVILTSAKGTWWTVRSSGCSERLDGIAYRDGHFVASITNRASCISPDGVKWVRLQQ